MQWLSYILLFKGLMPSLLYNAAWLWKFKVKKTSGFNAALSVYTQHNGAIETRSNIYLWSGTWRNRDKFREVSTFCGTCADVKEEKVFLIPKKLKKTCQSWIETNSQLVPCNYKVIYTVHVPNNRQGVFVLY